MEAFLDQVFRVNGTDGIAMGKYDGSAWYDATYPDSNVDGAPKGRYINLYGRRLAVGYVNYFSLDFPSRVWLSDIAAANDTLKWGLTSGTDLITTADSAVVTSNQAKFTDRNIKVGDSFVITSGTNAKTYAVSNLLNNANLEITPAPTYTGTGQSFWVGGNYLDVKTDDGDVVTGLGDNSGRLLIFKRNSLHRWAEGQLEVEEVKGAPGTPSHRSIVNIKTIPVTCYFSLNPIGIFVYNGTESVNATRGIQDYLEGIDQTTNFVGWRVGDLYKVYVGTITNTDKDISIPRAVIVLDLASGAVYFESLAHAITSVTEFVESSVTNIYATSSSTTVYQLESGATDNGTNFSWYIETGPFFPGGTPINKEFKGVEIYVSRGFGASVQYKIVGDERGNDDQQWRSIGQLESNLTTLDIPDLPRGRGIRFRISREPITEPIILEKIDVYWQPINNPYMD